MNGPSLAGTKGVLQALLEINKSVDVYVMQKVVNIGTLTTLHDLARGSCQLADTRFLDNRFYFENGRGLHAEFS